MDALGSISQVANVTYTQGFVGGGDYTGGIVATVGIRTWVRNALVTISQVASVTYAQGLIGIG